MSVGRARSLRPSDAVGLALVTAWLTWVVVASVLSHRPVLLGSTFVVAPLVVVAGVALGRLFGWAEARSPAGEPPPWWIEVVLVSFVAALLPGVRLQLAPGPVPLGYANANTAAAVQVLALCGLALVAGGRDRWARALLGVAAAASALAAVHHGSMAGLATGLPVVIVVMALLFRGARRGCWAAALGIVSFGGAGVVLLFLATRPTWPAAVLRALDPVRKDMWASALALWRAHPLTGGGPGSYVEVNPYGGDTDTMAAHSSLLQVGSELGLVGVVLLALLVLVGFLVATRAHQGRAVIASAAWTALWVHSLVDHLFDYPALALLAGVVIGWAGSAGRPAIAQSAWQERGTD